MQAEPRPLAVKESYAECQRIARNHYENFPVASWLLPRHVRKHVAAVYAFARAADDFADEAGMDPAERIDKLADWERQLAFCYEGKGTNPVFVALGATAERFAIPVELFQRLLAAFRADVSVRRYETFTDVLDYCSNSANPVGRIVLLLCGYRDETLFGWSDAICTALQLTNFWQDVSVDLDKDRVYIPSEDLRQFGVSETALFRREATEAFRRLLAFEVDRTRRLFRQGLPLFGMVRRDLALEVKATWHGGNRILDKIRARDYDVFGRRPSLGLADKLAVFMRAIAT